MRAEEEERRIFFYSQFLSRVSLTIQNIVIRNNKYWGINKKEQYEENILCVEKVMRQKIIQLSRSLYLTNQ